ncbi:MOP flippase family protein [candidate division KSB1 bacterium]|nr:MOP flippase family protein [candidate division KSB1 bacterium]RQW01912.1 MAG: colanic acid exporter [candidate division KSB1 bacterium]
MSSLKQRTVSGVLWSGMARMATQLVLFVVMAILARLLSADDFGIVGMAAIITVAIVMVNDKGLGMSIVQNKDLAETHLSTLFWTSVGFGLLLYLISFIASFPLAVFFRQEIVQPVVAIIALGFLIGGFGIVQKSLLTREMAFKQLAVVEVSATLAGGVLAIVLALMGFGVWSLVANVLARDLITVLVLWFICKWRPMLHFSSAELREYIAFSSTVLANDGAIYLITNVDVTIIGRVLGSAALGVYNFALYMVKLPVTRLSSIVAKVIFPAFSSLQNDPDKFKAAYLEAVKYISLITFPVLAGVAVFANEFVIIVLGEKWFAMARPLVILTPMAMLKSVGTIKNSVLMAVGRPDIELKWNLFYLLPLVGAVYYGARYGIVGVATAFTMLYVVTFPIIQHITNKQISVSPAEFCRSLAGSAIATSIMVLIALAVRYCKVVFNLPDLVVLLAGVAIASAAYLVTLWLIDRDDLLGFVRMMKREKTTPGISMTEVVISE